MSTNRFARLLQEPVPAEPFVRTALGLLEAGFREMALLALDDWARREIVADEMFTAVAALQRPSWGMWNGLLAALRNARKAIVRAGDAAQRQRLEEAHLLERVLGMMDRNADPSLAAALKPLGELTRAPVSSKLKLGAVLAMPIGLRNRVAHDTPTDPAWWEQAARALRPLVEFHAAGGADLKSEISNLKFDPPWFLTDDNQPLAFNGVEHDFAVLYVNDAGVSKAVPQRAQEALLAFGKLLGKADEQEKDFKKLLSKLAPEEIRGVMMGDWLVGHPVGEGGFATVHVGRQLSTGRKAAIKILRDGMEPETVARFQQEAAFLSRFRHPNIVGVYGYGQETWSAPRAFSLSGEPWFDAFSKTAPVKTFIALEWIEGRTLDDVFRAAVRSPETKPGLQTLIQWMAAAADALAAVHAAGIIHRDIKPHNLMVSGDGDARSGGAESQIKLMDFGIARMQKAERTLVTESGRALGTPAYMSPEQIRAADAEGEVGPASDVYSLCATFYELVTGQRLYRHDTATVEEVRTMKITGRLPVRPKLVVRGLPWEIETILLGGLEPEPADRYRTMDALQRDLRHFLTDEPIEYKRPSLPRRAQLVYRRNRAVSNLVALFLLLAIAGVVVYIRSIRAEEHRTAAQRDLARQNEAVATEQRALAETREKESRLRLAEVLSSNGHALLNRGDPAGALLWYVRALPLVADSLPADRLQRLRIGITLRQLPRPAQAWNYPLQPRQAVYVAALSRDGRRLATGEAWATTGTTSLDNARGATRVLDTATGKPLGPPIEHEKLVQAVSFCDDATRLVTLSGGVARVYDVATAKPLLPPVTDDKGIGRAELSRDGKLLLVAGDEGKNLRLIDIASGQPLFDAMTFDPPLGFAALNPDGSRFLTATRRGDHGAEGTVRVYDTASGRAASPPIVVPSLWSVVFSPDGKRIAVSSGEGWARIFDAATAQPLTPPMSHSGPVTQVAFSEDGTRLATVSGDKTARVWEAATAKPITPPMRHEEAPFALGFSLDGTRLATFAYDKAVRIWDARTGYPLMPALRQTAEIQSGAFALDGTDRFTVVTQSGASEWDFSRSADPGVVRVDIGDAKRAAISPDSSLIAIGASSGDVRLLDANTGQPRLPRLHFDQPVTALDFSPDGRSIVIASGNTARVLEIGRYLWPWTLAHAGVINTARFSPDGMRIVTASADKTARVWENVGARPLAPLLHAGAVNDATFSPDGRTVATASADQTARVWDAATGAPLTAPMDNGHSVSQVHFSPDGKLLLVPDDGGHVRLWDPRTGKSLWRIDYGNSTREASFSPDGTRMLAAGFSNFVKVYDTRSPQSPTAVLDSGPFSAVARFGPAGDLVYTASFGGSRLWDLAGSPVGPPLVPRPLRTGEFSPDGRWLVTLDSRLRTWDVTPDTRPAGDLDKLARLLSSRSLDARGVISPLDADDAVNLLGELRSRYPGEFAPQSLPITQAAPPVQPSPATQPAATR